MVDSEDLGFIRFEPVYYAVALNDKFAKMLLPELGDNPSRHGKLDQLLGGRKNTFGEQLRIPGRISGDKQQNRVKIIQRLFCPGYSSHRAIRRRASS